MKTSLFDTFVVTKQNAINSNIQLDLCFCFSVKLQDEVADLKASKDVSHSTLEDLDTEDLYVKLKVKRNFH